MCLSHVKCEGPCDLQRIFNKKKGKRQKAVYRLVTAPQGGTQKYTLAFAYDSPR